MNLKMHYLVLEHYDFSVPDWVTKQVLAIKALIIWKDLSSKVILIVGKIFSALFTEIYFLDPTPGELLGFAKFISGG